MVLEEACGAITRTQDHLEDYTGEQTPDNEETCIDTVMDMVRTGYRRG